MATSREGEVPHSEAPAPQGSAEARRMSAAARRHAIPFFVWIGALLIVQQLHLTNVVEVHDGLTIPGLGLVTQGGAYAWLVALGAVALALCRPWRHHGPLARRHVLPALAVGVGVFVLWVGFETELFRRLCPALADLYERWCVLPFGKTREPSEFVRLALVPGEAPPTIAGLAGQFFPASEPIPEGYMAAAGSAVGNFYAPSVCGWPLALVRLAGSAFVISVAEEFFWRGFLYRWIQNVDFLKVDPGRLAWPAFLGTAALFGAEHTEWLAGILCGLAYGALYVRSRDIWAVAIAHAVTNLLLGLYVFAVGAYQFW